MIYQKSMLAIFESELAVYNFMNIVFQVDLLFKVYGRDVVIVIFILITSLIMSRSIVINRGNRVQYTLISIIFITKSNLNPLTAKLFDLNFHPLEVVSR